ncbi:hypothetical protein HK102_006243, partial [Quaeritorhiza haematococci]
MAARPDSTSNATMKSTNTDDTQRSERWVVLCEYVPARADELYLQKGDIVAVRKTYPDGWCFGRNVTRNHKAGMFPLNYLESQPIYIPADSDKASAPSVSESSSLSFMYSPMSPRGNGSSSSSAGASAGSIVERTSTTTSSIPPNSKAADAAAEAATENPFADPSPPPYTSGVPKAALRSSSILSNGPFADEMGLERGLTVGSNETGPSEASEWGASLDINLDLENPFADVNRVSGGSDQAVVQQIDKEPAVKQKRSSNIFAAGSSSPSSTTSSIKSHRPRSQRTSCCGLSKRGKLVLLGLVLGGLVLTALGLGLAFAFANRNGNNGNGGDDQSLDGVNGNGGAGGNRGSTNQGGRGASSQVPGSVVLVNNNNGNGTGASAGNPNGVPSIIGGQQQALTNGTAAAGDVPANTAGAAGQNGTPGLPGSPAPALGAAAAAAAAAGLTSG